MRNKIQLSLFLTLLIFGLQGKFAYSASPVVDFSSTGYCVDSPTFFLVDNSVTNVSDVDTWHWAFNDGTFSNEQNPQHTYAGPGIYNVILTITDIYGDVGSVNHDITIQQLPVPFFLFDTPDCSNNSIQFTDLSTTPDGYIQEWKWDFDDGSPTETILFPDDPHVKHLFANPGTYSVTLTVKNSVNSCKNSISIPITITPSPIANFHFNGKCENQAVAFTDASIANGAGNIVSWSWDFGDPVSGVTNISNLENPTHVFANAGSYTVKLIVTNFNTCTDTIEKLVVINASPPAGFTFTPPCLKELVSFNPDPSIVNLSAIALWYWDFGDGITSNASNPDHAFMVPDTYFVTLKITDLLGCENEITHNVIVDPLPAAQFSTTISNCAGAKVNFLNQSTATIGSVIKWEWDFGDGNSVIVNQPGNPDVSHVYTLPKTYNVKLTVTATNGCSNSINQTITIKPNPLANFTFASACQGTSADFTNLTQLNGAGSITQWQWDFGDPGSGIDNVSSLQHPEHEFSVTGNPIVQLIVIAGNGCSDTITYPVTVNPPPQVNFYTSNNCQNSTVNFIPDATVMNIATVSSWFWEFGSGITSMIQNPKHTFTTAGTYNVKLTIVDNSGCTNSITRTVKIAPEPVVDFLFSQPACLQSEVQFDNISTVPGAGFIVKSEWDFGDGNFLTSTTLASVSHTYAIYGGFNVMLKVTTNDGCEKTQSLPIVILPKPLANFTVQNACVNTSVQFTDLSQAGAGAISGWSWNFGDPVSGAGNSSTIKFPSHTFISAGTYPVTLIVENNGGCSDTIVKTIQIHTLPVVDFASAPGCVNESTQFTSSLYVNTGLISSYYWSFGDGYTSTAVDPSHTYTSSGTFNVTLTITDTKGCNNSKTYAVVIAVPPSALFDISAQNCTGSPTFFSVVPFPSGSPVTSYYWEFGDGTNLLLNSPAGENVSHSYAAGGNYKVVLTVQTASGCKSKSQRTFTVSASPVAQFKSDNSCTGSTVNFTDLSISNSGPSLVNWSWDFGDPGSFANNTSNLQHPYHVFNNPGTYTVLLQIGNASGCMDTISKTIVIKPRPAVDFDWAGSCMGNSTKFTTNTSVTNVATIISYDWNFGDGTAHSYTQNPVHNYAVTGNFTVTLTISNTSGCKNTITHLVSILPQPSAFFSSNNSCIGASSQFVDQSFTPNGAIITAWDWDFGVNAAINDTSDQQNPSWVYNSMGIYNVKLTVTSQNGCQNTVKLNTQVFGNPTANFTYTASACDNGAVYFEDSSYNKYATIVGLKWEFETNHFSNLQDPVHVFYGADSCYDVRLIATDVRGCVDTVVKQACVPGEFDFSFVSTNSCIFDSAYFEPQQGGNSAGNLVSFNWNFGDPSSGIHNTSTKQLPSHFYTNPGTYTISLKATDINSCSKIVYRDIVVVPKPVSYFTYIEGSCDSSIFFNESSYSIGSNISKWFWDFGDGFTKTVLAPDLADLSHQYDAPGNYSVSLTVVNSIGCTISSTVNDIMVKPCLTAAFELNDTTMICQNNKISFNDNSYSTNPSNEWNWDFGDGTQTKYFTFTNRVNHVYKSSGTFIVQLVISTIVAGQRVSDTAKMNVNVNPTPLPDFISSVVCHEQNAIFTNMTSGNGTRISSYNWSFGDPFSITNDTSTLKNPLHLYNAPGTYDVKLKVENSLGCKDSIQKSLTVHGLPDANYSYSVSCAGDNTAFKNLSIAAVAPIVDWEWTFYNENGIAGKTDIQNPDFIFNTPGVYLVNLKVTDEYGCMDTINQNVTTWSVPKSFFTYTKNFEGVQGQIEMKNTSVDAVKYYWDFGDGSYSYIESPVTLYKDDGSYEISLVTWSEHNCTDTIKAQYEFMVKGLYIPNAFSPTNMKTEVQLLKPIGINLVQYLFEVFDRWGNLIWSTNALDEAGRPVEGWDGTYKGALMPEGAYPWRAFGIFKDGSIWEAENVGNNDNLPNSKVGTATMIH